MPTVRLTEKLVSTLTPAGAREIFWDAEDRGFGVRVGQRSKVFVVQSRVNGRKVRQAIGEYGARREDGHVWSVLLARKRAKEMLGQFAAGVDTARGARAGGRTLRDGLTLHLENMKRDRCSQRSMDDLKKETLRIFADWLDRPIVELTGLELSKVYSGIIERLADKPKTGSNPENTPGAALANRAVQHISGIWNSLDKLSELPGRNPVKSITKYSLLERESRIPHEGFGDWFDQIEELSEVPRDVHLLTLFTSIRSAGVRHLRHEDWDAKQKILRVARAKGDRPYTIPLSKTAIEILKRRKQANVPLMAPWGGDDGWVFPTLTRAKPHKVIPCAEPKRPGLQPLHDLRRTWNSVAAEIGVPLEIRNMIMNHEGKGVDLKISRGVNLKHYTKPQNWDYAATWMAQVDAALWERIKGKKSRRRR
jgi:integrase